MLTFSPETLKNSIIDAIKVLSFLQGDIEEINFDDFLKLDVTEYDDIEINEHSLVCLYVGECDYPMISVGQFINYAQNKSRISINDAQSYAKSDHEVFFLINIFDSDTYEVLGNSFKGRDIFSKRKNTPASVLEKEITVDGVTYYASLYNGFSFYHLLVEESGDYDEYFPSYSPDDCFIRIRCDQSPIDMGVADALATAYAFELQASFEVRIPFSTGRIETNVSDRSDETLYGLETQMFPLIHGAGAADLLNLYNTAKNANDVDFKILGFTKVIEYIAPTITQKELIDTVSLKLTSLNVFNPTATFIFELGAIYDKHRNTTTKDSELIKTSILTAVTLDEIWNVIPDFIKGKQTGLPDDSEHAVWLTRIAEYIYSTRNEIAHAKANYEKRGTECPRKHKTEFACLLDVIAVRCIRWFALQPEEKRAVLK